MLQKSNWWRTYLEIFKVHLWFAWNAENQIWDVEFESKVDLLLPHGGKLDHAYKGFGGYISGRILVWPFTTLDTRNCTNEDLAG